MGGSCVILHGLVQSTSFSFMSLATSMYAAKTDGRVTSGRLALLCALWISGLGLPTGKALPATIVPKLYEASVPAAGTSDAARKASFAAALRVVAVRASGRRDAGDRLGSATLADAGRYVQRFGDNPDGTLLIGFDRASVDRVLAQSDLPVWGSERPVTLVWLSIEDASGQQNWVGLDAALPEARALQQVAELRGLPIVWPVMDSEDRMLGNALGNDPQTATRLATLASRYRADAVLVGRARRGAGSESAVRWSLHFGPTTTDTVGSLPEGVHFAADQLARLFASSGGAAQTLFVDVAAITDLKAYAETLNYLEGLTLVRATQVEHIAGDSVRFRLQVLGDAGLLARAVRLGSRLVPEQGDGVVAPDRLALRYQPGALP
jgi:hypothetical protein